MGIYFFHPLWEFLDFMLHTFQATWDNQNTLWPRGKHYSLCSKYGVISDNLTAEANILRK